MQNLMQEANTSPSVPCISHIAAVRVERFVPLVDLGVVLHRSRHSESGAVVLHAAVDHHDQSPEAHYALGNAYAVLGDYNRSATCFNNTVKLDPKHEGALKRRHAVLCHDRLETALETQHKYGRLGDRGSGGGGKPMAMQ